MRRILLFLSVLVFGLTAFGTKEVEVKGHKRKDGTVVQPHRRTAPNTTKNDNWSTRGNVNPYTGKPGTRPRDGEEAKEKLIKSPAILLSHSPETKAARQRLESEILQCERIIDRYVKQSSFSTPSHLRVSAQEYEAAHKRKEEAERELKQLPSA